MQQGWWAAIHKRSFGELSLGIKTPSKIWTYGVAAHFELS
jgi:hypothetical protein